MTKRKKKQPITLLRDIRAHVKIFALFVVALFYTWGLTMLICVPTGKFHVDRVVRGMVQGVQMTKRKKKQPITLLRDIRAHVKIDGLDRDLLAGDQLTITMTRTARFGDVKEPTHQVFITFVEHIPGAVFEVEYSEAAGRRLARKQAMALRALKAKTKKRAR